MRARIKGRILPMKKATSGFTIVELLIVIVAIAILAAITIVAYNGIQSRAIDTRRESDMATIKKALLAYNVVRGGVPNVSTYSTGTGFGGWDVSAHTSWLSFLRPTNGNMPVDPQNIVASTVDAGSVGNYLYRYYCYPAGSANAYPDTAAVSIGYRQSTNAWMSTKFPVDSCLASLPV